MAGKSQLSNNGTTDNGYMCMYTKIVCVCVVLLFILGENHNAVLWNNNLLLLTDNNNSEKGRNIFIDKRDAY